LSDIYDLAFCADHESTNPETISDYYTEVCSIIFSDELFGFVDNYHYNFFNNTKSDVEYQKANIFGKALLR